MRGPTREAIRPTYRIELADIIRQAFDEDRTVELVDGTHGYAILIDGLEVFEVASETFGWPVDDCEFDDEAAEFVDGCIDRRLDRRRRRRIERRKSKLQTTNHAASEGVTGL
ncbi:hypothetical protein [Haloarcula amylovorans]|uniref:hypothetical protein n=1 Tax=Haloarcula amylovorans TaxID=2562280 RepID=UPI001075E36B|nr:hypothetical protein [Halomicroarcula amylolytica]